MLSVPHSTDCCRLYSGRLYSNEILVVIYGRVRNRNFGPQCSVVDSRQPYGTHVHMRDALQFAPGNQGQHMDRYRTCADGQTTNWVEMQRTNDHEHHNTFFVRQPHFLIFWPIFSVSTDCCDTALLPLVKNLPSS